MKIIERSIKIAYELFPTQYKKRYRTFHFAFIYRRNNLLAIGLNQPSKENGKALYFAQRFSTPITQRYKYLHAETDAIRKLWGREVIDNSMNMVILRLNKSRELQNSRPCLSCLPIIKALGFGKVFYSNSENEVEKL